MVKQLGENGKYEYEDLKVEYKFDSKKHSISSKVQISKAGEVVYSSKSRTRTHTKDNYGRWHRKPNAASNGCTVTGYILGRWETLFEQLHDEANQHKKDKKEEAKRRRTESEREKFGL